MRPKLHDAAVAPLTEVQRERVARTVERILSSPAFRNSKQCQRFLDYVVRHSFSDADDCLKERTIGTEVFGRDPDYDTADDPVVRVRATEVRKRLAQYYQESAAPDDVRLDIPSGSYRAEIHWGAPKLRAQRTPHGWMWLAGVVLVAAALLLLYLLRGGPSDTTIVDIFWQPAFESQDRVLIHCGQPIVYFLSRGIHDKYRSTVPAEKQRGSYPLVLDPSTTIRGDDVIPITDQFVGIGNAHTAALLSGMFAGKRKAVEIRYANDVSFSDLRSSPSVLVGAFSNEWTLEMTSRLRFVFEQDGGRRQIRDRTANKTWRLEKIAPDGKTPEDYALVSRVFDSATGQFLISAAGITQYGTRAAGEFLTSVGAMSEAFAGAPPDWPKRNVQVLLHTTVYKGTPAPPRIVLTHVW
jgi:hypothetical protein